MWNRSIALNIVYGTFNPKADSDAQSLVILASYSQQNSHVVLLTHKMSSHSATEATRSHRPIEVILNSPGRNVDRNAFARLVSPGRGNNFLITYILTAALGTILRLLHNVIVRMFGLDVGKQERSGHSLSSCCSVESLCVTFIAGANFIRLYSGED